jgi:hypothetical protein
MANIQFADDPAWTIGWIKTFDNMFTDSWTINSSESSSINFREFHIQCDWELNSEHGTLTEMKFWFEAYTDFSPTSIPINNEFIDLTYDGGVGSPVTKDLNDKKKFILDLTIHPNATSSYFSLTVPANALSIRMVAQVSGGSFSNNPDNIFTVYFTRKAK